MSSVISAKEIDDLLSQINKQNAQRSIMEFMDYGDKVIINNLIVPKSWYKRMLEIAANRGHINNREVPRRIERIRRARKDRQ